MPQTLIPVLGAEDLDLDAAAIGLALGLGGVARMLGAALTGVVSDRFSRRAALLPCLVLQAIGVGLLAVGVYDQAGRGAAIGVVSAVLVVTLAAAATLPETRSGRASRRREAARREQPAP
jgi:MFS family permease